MKWLKEVFTGVLVAVLVLLVVAGVAALVVYFYGIDLTQ